MSHKGFQMMKFGIASVCLALAVVGCSTQDKSVEAAPVRNIYVAPTGNDASTQPTSINTPLKTIQKAAEIAQPGDVINVRAGTYRETIIPTKDGKEGAPIVFQPYNNEVVTISGTDVIRNFTAEAGGVYRATMPGDFFVSKINQADQIFVNGQMLNLARFPNTGFDVSRPSKGTITKFISKTENKETRWWTSVFEDENLESKPDGFYNGAEIYVQPNKGGWSWTFSGEVIDSKGKQLTLRTRSGSGKDTEGNVYAVGSRYYLFNKRNLLDANGEWFHDKEAGVLYLKAPDGSSLTGKTVEAKKRDWAFDLTGRSYITLKGFRLFGCALTTDNSAGGDAKGYNADGTVRYPWRDKNWVAPAHHITVDGLDARYINHFTDVSGHFFLQWPPITGLVMAGSDHVIQNTRVQYSAGNGISLQGNRHKCLNNYILDTNYMSVDAAAISTGTVTPTRDVEIAYNTIDRTARTGITIRSLQNSDPNNLVTRIHHNVVANFLMQDWDAGAFYTFGQDGKFTRIDHNIFYCEEPRTDMSYGAYWDFSKNYILDHNVIWGVVVPIQITHEFDPEKSKTANMIIYNNTIMPNEAQWTKAFGSSVNNGSVMQNNIIKAASFKDSKGTLILRWPDYGSGSVTPINNLLWGAPQNPGWKEGIIGPSDKVVNNPGFANIANRNFLLQPGSPAIDSAKPVETIERDGIKVPAFNEPAVGGGLDMGAYEVSGEMWKAGSSLVAREKKPVTMLKTTG